MKRTAKGWKSDFPIQEEVEDFSGKQRSFVIRCHEGPLGYTVRASEVGKSDLGYEFSAYSETSPYSALGRVRDKMRRGLATRHVTASPGERHMLHDTLRGRIASDGQGHPLLIVDGIPLTIEDIESFFSTHEGWDFELRIVVALE